jgi:hypothetical protein
MISYLITSSLLLVPVWLIYQLLLRNRANAHQRKWFLYLAVIGSLVAPMGGNWFSWELPEPDPIAASHPFGMRIEPSHLQQYCQCEAPNYRHRVEYRANIWYQLLLDHKHWLGWMIIATMLWSALRLLWQLRYLHKLVRNGELRAMELDGQPFFLLLTKESRGVGAFRLRHAYLIWDAQLLRLSSAEQEAVFRHELSHLHQHNTLERAGLSLIQCLWFFHPLFYAIRRELELLSEFIADEDAASHMSSRKAYAHLLLTLKSQQLQPLVAGFAQQSLRTRIEFLLSANQTVPLPLWLIGLLIVGSTQMLVGKPLSSEVDRQLTQLETYEKIYHQVSPDTRAAIYCTDCETVCFPTEE